MASIGNLKEDAATEGEAAQRRSRSKKGDLVAIALVCESARHFNKLEKLLIDNTVQQLPELAALAGGEEVLVRRPVARESTGCRSLSERPFHLAST